MNRSASTPALRDDFPDTPARRAVVAVVRAYGATQRLMSSHFARFGLTPAQFQLLTVVNRLQGARLTQRRLGRELYVSFPNVTVMLARLQDQGLIERHPNPADGREKLVQITPRGKEMLREVWTDHSAQLEHVMMGLDNDERNELARLLNKMIVAHDANAADGAGQGKESSARRRPDILSPTTDT